MRGHERPSQGRRHDRSPLVGLNTLGLPIVGWGLVVSNAWMVVAGLAVHMAGKNWFLDRMVWIYEDMSRSTIPLTDLPAAAAGAESTAGV
jgi:hypothetical protein